MLSVILLSVVAPQQLANKMFFISQFDATSTVAGEQEGTYLESSFEKI
jgi:hypothetical protein